MLHFPDAIDTTVIDFFVAVFRVAHIDANVFQLAKIDQVLTDSAVARTTTSVLSHVSAAVSLVLALILTITVVKKRSLKKSDATEAPMVQSESGLVAAAPAGHLQNKWSEVMRHLESTHENDWKLGVVEADKLVDIALAQSGFPGESFGDRLTNIKPGMLTSLDGLWWAHKIRNRIAHEVDYFLRYTEAKAAMSYYEAALAELHLI